MKMSHPHHTLQNKNLITFKRKIFEFHNCELITMSRQEMGLRCYQSLLESEEKIDKKFLRLPFKLAHYSFNLSDLFSSSY